MHSELQKRVERGGGGKGERVQRVKTEREYKREEEGSWLPRECKLRAKCNTLNVRFADSRAFELQDMASLGWMSRMWICVCVCSES